MVVERASSSGVLTWVDLATFDVAAARRFYARVFGWTYSLDHAGYVQCAARGCPSAALYTMPAFFERINMPSFWMSYVAVAELDWVVETARTLGGRVELEERGAFGKIALIRDPSGAGFTCHEGQWMQSPRDPTRHGRWAWSELLVSELAAVRSFYAELFGWRVTALGGERHAILDGRGETIATIQVASTDVKGGADFWAVYFAVDDRAAAARAVEDAGGQLLGEHVNAEGVHLLARDDQGAAFFLSETTTRAFWG
ncbi:MAG: VOC family protein [Myxococcales bacterium]|nr:VOC family protein [Myxococcales bacterium]